MPDREDSVAGETDARFRALQDLSKLLNNPRLSNVSFQCQDGVIYAVREVLAARSDFFDKLLYGGLKEAAQEQIQLPTALSWHLLLIFEFLYTGTLSLPETINADLVMGIYELSRQYTIEDLQKMLVEALPSLLTKSNAGTFLTSASQVFFFPIGDVYNPQKIEINDSSQVSSLIASGCFLAD